MCGPSSAPSPQSPADPAVTVPAGVDQEQGFSTEPSSTIPERGPLLEDEAAESPDASSPDLPAEDESVEWEDIQG